MILNGAAIIIKERYSKYLVSYELVATHAAILVQFAL